MQIPLELSFRGVDATPDLEALIRRRVAKLERYCDHISACRVAVERPQRRQESGNLHRVRIDLTIPPGHELVVRREPSQGDSADPLPAVVRRAFDAVERQLKKLVDRQQGEVKTHEEPRAFVVRLFRKPGYGFVKTPEGRELYFHRNAVVGADWKRLEVGTQVRFEEAMGEDGPQATTIQIVDKPGSRLPAEGAPTIRPPAGWGRRPRR